MTWYDIVGWISIALVLGTYAWRRNAFDLANMFLWPAVIAPSVARGAWPSATISFAFGMIGTYRWWKIRRPVAAKLSEDRIAALAALQDDLARRRRMKRSYIQPGVLDMREALSPTIYDPNGEMDKGKLAVLGYVETDPGVYVKRPLDKRDHSIPVDRKVRTPQEQLDWWVKTGRMDLPEDPA